MKGKILIALFLGTFSLSAQELSDTTKVNIHEVLIEGSRINTTSEAKNSNVQVITAHQIVAMPVQNVQELLMYASGVDMRRRGPMGAQSDITIDGSTFDQVLVLINGIKMSDPQTGHHMMNLPVPVEIIDHVEIIRGAAGRSYGSNALAGVVNIVTKKPDHDNVFASVYGGSSFKKDTSNNETYYNSGAVLGATLYRENNTHLFAVSYDKSNGYRYNTGFDNYKLFYQNELKAGKHLIKTTGGYVNNAFGANSFYAAPGDAESEETVQTAVISVDDSWALNDKFKIRPSFSYRYGNDDYIYIRQKPNVFHNHHETNVVNTALNASFTQGNHEAGIGVEWRNENIRSSNLGFNTRDHIGMYAEYNWKRNKLTWGAGVYGHYNSDWGFEIFPGIDIGYMLTSSLKVYANAGTGQRLPTYTDLFYDGPSNIGNANLVPERGITGEAGLRYRNNALQAEASVSYKSIDDFIDYTRTDSTYDWQPNNFQTINTTVYSLNFTYALGNALQWKSGELNISSKYEYLEPAVDVNNSFESKYAIEALRHQWLSTIQFVKNKISVGVSARYQFRINGNDYTLVDSRISYKPGKFNIFADVNNIFDTQYSEISSVPLPGRWFMAGLKFNLKTN